MEESTIELGTMILERHRSTYQVRLEGMRPIEIEAAASILRFVASIERRWMLGTTEVASAPLLMQINNSPATRQNRVIVTGRPMDEPTQGRITGDAPIEHASASESTSDLDHTAVPANPGDAPVSQFPQAMSAESSSPASYASPLMTDRATEPTASPSSAETSQTFAPTGSTALRPDEQAQHATPAPNFSSAAGTPQSHVPAAVPKLQEPELDPDTVLSGAALLWGKPPSVQDEDAARQVAVKAVEASLPHPHLTPAASVPRQPPSRVVPAAGKPQSHVEATEPKPQKPGLDPDTLLSGAALLWTKPPSAEQAAAAKQIAIEAFQPSSPGLHPTPLASAPTESPAQVVTAAAPSGTAPPPEPVLLTPVSVAQAPPHTPAHAQRLPQPPQAVPAHSANIPYVAEPQGVAAHDPTAASTVGSSQVDFDVLRAQMLRAFARDMALEAERRGVETWDR